MNDSVIGLQTLGDAIERCLLSELDTRPDPRFAELEVLRNLAGEATGHVRVYAADRLVKASALSIRIGPGRYFNIHVIPEARYDIPRFVYEGMLLPMGSQVSLDLFPDLDAPTDIGHLLELYSEAVKVYDEARQDPGLRFEASRQLHMRAFSSPMFLCTFGVREASLPAIERYAHGYFDAWLGLYQKAGELSPAVAAAREARREHMARTMIELDPDRHLVVQVFGEETTQAIEAATML